MACQATVILEPNSTQQLAAGLRRELAAAAAAGRSVKVRATHKHFHSTNAFNCPSNWSHIYAPSSPPRAAHGAGPDVSVAVLLGGMDKVLWVDQGSSLMRVQAGMTVKQLLAEATKAGMSVPLGAVPAFADLMLGGVLLTGAHGSAFRGRSHVADLVVEMTWVNASGAVTTSRRDSAEGRAIAGGLGLLGVVTELTLQLGPPSHTMFDTVWKKPDSTIGADILAMLQETPNMLVVWRPDLRKYNAVRLREVPTWVPPTGAEIQIDMPMLLASAFGVSLRAWEETARPSFLMDEAMCMVSKEVSISHGWASSLQGRALLSGVGPTNEMQSVSCGDKCAWSEGIANLAMWDTHFTADIADLPAWIEDVKKVMELDFWRPGEARRGRCLPPGYFWLRFGGGSGADDMISPGAGLRNGTAALQLSFMTSKATAPRWGIKHGHVLEVLEQLTLCKYRGRPHWGKNHERTYTHPECRVPPMYQQWDALRALQARHDPAKVFEPPLFTKMASAAPPHLGPGCALSGECFCREDAHCGAGRTCVASAAFPQFKACRRVGSQ